MDPVQQLAASYRYHPEHPEQPQLSMHELCDSISVISP